AKKSAKTPRVLAGQPKSTGLDSILTRSTPGTPPAATSPPVRRSNLVRPVSSQYLLPAMPAPTPPHLSLTSLAMTSLLKLAPPPTCSPESLLPMTLMAMSPTILKSLVTSTSTNLAATSSATSSAMPTATKPPLTVLLLSQKKTTPPAPKAALKVARAHLALLVLAVRPDLPAPTVVASLGYSMLWAGHSAIFLG